MLEQLSSSVEVVQPHPCTAQRKVSSSGTSTVSTSVVNLGKAIMGAGVLSLPSGIAAFTDSSTGLLPSVAILIVIGTVAAYSFRTIGRICEYFGARSLSEAWSKTVSPQFSSFLTVIIVVNTFLSCLAYSIVIGAYLSV
jgi:amino acid permease